MFFLPICDAHKVTSALHSSKNWGQGDVFQHETKKAEESVAMTSGQEKNKEVNELEKGER